MFLGCCPLQVSTCGGKYLIGHKRVPIKNRHHQLIARLQTNRYYSDYHALHPAID